MEQSQGGQAVKYKPPQPQSYSAETAALITQLKDRIKTLEEAGSLALGYAAKGDLESADEVWDKAKEAKL